MLNLLILTASFAHAETDIGKSKTFGVGAATGVPYVAFTGKQWLDADSGLAFYVGTSVFFHTVRGSYQKTITRWGEDWSWGELPLYWHAGVQASLYTIAGYVGPSIGRIRDLGAV